MKVTCNGSPPVRDRRRPVLRAWPPEPERRFQRTYRLPAATIATAALAPDHLRPAVTGQISDQQQWRKQVAADLEGICGRRASTLVEKPCPEVRVLVVTTFDLEKYVVDAVWAGAAGCLLADVDPAALIGGIHTVVHGNALVASAVTRSLFDHAKRQQDDPVSGISPAVLNSLSDREREVLTCMARGLSNAQIASELFLGETTVKSHVSNLLAKLHLRSRVQAVVLAYEAGLVKRGDVDYEDLLDGP